MENTQATYNYFNTAVKYSTWINVLSNFPPLRKNTCALHKHTCIKPYLGNALHYLSMR